MGWRGYHWSVNLAYWLECRVGDIWIWIAGNSISCWFDPIPSAIYRLRKALEKKFPVS